MSPLLKGFFLGAVAVSALAIGIYVINRPPSPEEIEAARFQADAASICGIKPLGVAYRAAMAKGPVVPASYPSCQVVVDRGKDGSDYAEAVVQSRYTLASGQQIRQWWLVKLQRSTHVSWGETAVWQLTPHPN